MSKQNRENKGRNRRILTIHSKNESELIFVQLQNFKRIKRMSKRITDLPDEMILQIALRTDYLDLQQLCNSDERMAFICRDGIFWRKKAEYDFGVKPDEFTRRVNGDERSDKWEPMEPSEVYIMYATKNDKAYYGSEKYVDYIDKLVEKAAERGDVELINHFRDSDGAEMTDTISSLMELAIEGFAKGGFMDKVSVSLIGVDHISGYISAVRGFAERGDEESVNYYLNRIFNLEKPLVKRGAVPYAYVEAVNSAIVGFAAGGHLDLLVKFSEIENPFGTGNDVGIVHAAAFEAAANNHLNVIKYIESVVDFDMDYVVSILDGAAKGGNVNILEYLFEKYADVMTELDLEALEGCVDFAISYGHNNVIIYIQSKIALNLKIVMGNLLSPENPKGQNLDLLKYLYEHYPDDLDDNEEDEEDDEEDLDGLDGLEKKEGFLYASIEGGDPEMVEFLLERYNYEDLIPRIIDFTANNGNDKMMVYLMKHFNHVPEFRGTEWYGKVSLPLTIKYIAENMELENTEFQALALNYINTVKEESVNSIQLIGYLLDRGDGLRYGDILSAAIRKNFPDLSLYLASRPHEALTERQKTVINTMLGRLTLIGIHSEREKWIQVNRLLNPRTEDDNEGEDNRWG